MSLGPLQVLVVKFDEPDFTGEIEAELNRLHDAGVLRVLDFLVVAKDHEGDVAVVRSGERHTGQLGHAVLSLGEPPTDGYEVDEDADVWFVADAIAPGDAAAVAVLEHQWAIPLREAIERAGGRDVVAEWADADDLASLGVALSS
jgi:hypothetical protein